ncbi:hypothetical protein LEA60_11465 [Salmonella enterica]|uniref:hypothetical protein n=1 Tax=Salmonella sp. SAL04162 TaxID=3159782 RepID=UPI002A1F5914|nr:hypothetical protein [Salmonella enterica]
MRYLLLIISLTGGLLSFNSSADTEKLTDAQCQAKPTLKDFSMSKWAQKGSDFYAAYQGCIYLNVSELGFCAIGDMCLGDWEPVKAFNPSSGDSETPDTKPDKPDTGSSGSGGGTTVIPPVPDTGSSGGSSGFSAALSSINSSSPDYLYEAYHFTYNFDLTPDENKKLAQAFLSKLSNVTPPSYYAVDHVYNMMEQWQHYYNSLSTDTSPVIYLWQSSHFVGGEHRYLGDIVLPVNSCPYGDGSTGQVTTDCAPLHKPLVINDPLYASESDYKDGITRCMRNPDDASCHSSGDSDDSDDPPPLPPVPVVPDTSGHGNTGSGSVTHSSCSSGWVQDGNFCRQGSKFYCLTGNYDIASDSCISSSGSGSGGNPDSSGGGTPDSCPSGSHHEPGTLAGSCTTDLNPGGGGGSGSGSTDSNDNGDVVAAINAFHADNNKNHQELMDDLNKKPAAPDYTGMEGEFSSMVGGAMSGITDSVKSAWDAGKAAFGEGLSGIDSMLPDIKTSFDLPPGFEAASTGRCIPVVLDFDIKLVGIPDYHFHAVGTQVCLLYDKYIRPVLNFCMVILSFFVIHRLLIRSAEFLTDGRH